MPRPPRSLARLLRYYLLHYRLLGFPLAFYLLVGPLPWVVEWCTGGGLRH